MLDELVPEDDAWLETDSDTIDQIVDSENVLLMQKMIYKLARERNECQVLGFGQGWDACSAASARRVEQEMVHFPVAIDHP